MKVDRALRSLKERIALNERIAHFDECSECQHFGWVGACGWDDPIDPDPMRPPETDEEPWTPPDVHFRESRSRSSLIAALCLIALCALIAVRLIR